MPKPNLNKLSRKQETISKFFTPRVKNDRGAATCNERCATTTASTATGPSCKGTANDNVTEATDGSDAVVKCSDTDCTIDDSSKSDISYAPHAKKESISARESSKRSAEQQDGSDAKRPSTSSNQASLAKATTKKLHAFSFQSSHSDLGLRCGANTDTSSNSSLQEEIYDVKKTTKSTACSQSKPSTHADASVSGGGNRPSECQKTFKSKPGAKLTPLEQQFVAIKEKYPDAILFVECGYKYRFFGDDAEVAAKELNIFAHPDHSFMTASIPVIRLFVHVRRLVAKGYKVGVVKQTETAALKASGDNKSGPFTRELSALYTKSTLIGEDIESLTAEESTESSLGGHLMCIFEDLTPNGSHAIAVMSVQVTNGEIMYDCFEDNVLREQLETRISHIQPVEILLPETLSDKTEYLIKSLSAISSVDDDRIRLQRLSDSDFEYEKISRDLDLLFQGGSASNSTNSDPSGVRKLPKPVQSCFYALWKYLKDFNLQKLLMSSSELTKFSLAEHYLQLNGITQRNLELFYNLSDHKVKGSLLWVMDHCRTAPGRRLLRKWIVRPLKDCSTINARLDAVTELINPSESVLLKMLEILPTIPDTEKALAAVFHKKCSPLEFWKICDSLRRLYSILNSHQSSITSEVTSDLLKNILKDLLECLESAEKWAGCINAEAARDGDKTKIFSSLNDFLAMKKCQDEITSVLRDIHDHRREVRLALRTPALEYATVMGTEFLIEVKNNLVHLVPDDWMKISGTKSLARYHSPFLLQSIQKLNNLKEQLMLEANDAWLQFLEQFENETYPYFKKAACLLAEFDCLVSLSRVACLEGYCRPDMSEEVVMCIKQGRHPVVEMLINKQDQFVPNDTELSGEKERAMIITGPNMGGKSSYIKQVALICIMAHIGSYVPAESATIPVLHSIHTRMGASDDLFRGRSTFMVELQEAAQTLSAASKRSLVVLDELGRGTATHDGMAIAYATLKYLISKIKCLTLFVTHYPLLAELESVYPENVVNCHMAFLGSEEDGMESDDTVTFLYSLQRGIADRSFGLNVARLACIPQEIISTAAQKSQELQKIIDRRLLQRKLCHDLINADESTIKEVLKT